MTLELQTIQIAKQNTKHGKRANLVLAESPDIARLGEDAIRRDVMQCQGRCPKKGSIRSYKGELSDLLNWSGNYWPSLVNQWLKCGN